MATLLSSVASELSPRRKLMRFQFALLRAARVLYNAGKITNAQFLAVEGLYNKPWRKSLATADLISWVFAGGANYVVGDVLTLVKTGGSGGKVVVASVNSAGAVRAVLPVVPGTGYTVGIATVTGGTGTGAKVGLRAAVGGTVDVMDQVRVDVQYASTGQTWTSAIIRDWGNPSTTLGWLENASGTTVSTVYAGGTAYNVGQVVTYNGSSYYCYKATTGNAPGTGVPATDAYWVVLPSGGTNHSGQLTCATGVALAAITGRLAAISQGLI